MFARPLLSTVLAGSLATAALALGSLAPASADPAAPPAAGDIVGVGSDTSQFVLDNLADGATVAGSAVPGYNATATTGKLRSFHALTAGTSAQIVVRQGTQSINRPNGSGQGKATLYNPSNPNIDFARSSSALNDAEVNAGLYAYPFAVDGLGLATARTTNAPATLTSAQIVGIYQGTIKNWSEVGGKAGTIVPQIPQSGSGTRSFFTSELKKLNGGVDVTLASTVVDVQEHDDAIVKSNPNAIAPFSTGRAELAGTVTIVGGFTAKRALYNVVRAADRTRLAGVFGADGFVCSTDARPLIEAAGFDQLARDEFGGVCGEATQSATSNFTTNEVVVTGTTLTASSPAAGSVAFAATVDAKGADVSAGTVELLEGTTKVATARFAQGRFATTLTGVAAGSHTYTARYVPASGVLQEGSTSAAASVVVRVAPVLRAGVSPTRSSFGQARVLSAVVTTPSGAPATGQVRFTFGGARTTVALDANGKATLTAGASTPAGAYAIKMEYLGSELLVPASASGTHTIQKATPAIGETFPSAVSTSASGTRGTVVVNVPGVQQAISGTVTIYAGTKVFARGTVSRGVAAITLPKVGRGTHTLRAVYSGDRSVNGRSQTFTVTGR